MFGCKLDAASQRVEKPLALDLGAAESPNVDSRDIREIEGIEAERLRAQREVNLLEVEEEPFVESAQGAEHRTPDKKNAPMI